MDEELKRNLLNKRKEILCLVKEEIDKVLNPNKPQYDLTKTEGELLNSLAITEEQYYWALSVSADSDFDLHLKRPLDSCFINKFLVSKETVVLRRWERSKQKFGFIRRVDKG